MTEEPTQAAQTPNPAIPEPATQPDAGQVDAGQVDAGQVDADHVDVDQPSTISDADAQQALRDIGDVPAVEVVTTVALHLMSAAAVKCGLGEGTEQDAAGGPEKDLAEARILITALAGLVQASAPDLGTFHAGPLRDGLKSLQAAFREASPFPDPPGQGPGENLPGSGRR